MDKASPEDLAWAGLQSVKPGENSQPAAGYEVAIGSLQAFVNQFPQSPHLSEAGQTLAAFAEEKRRVEAGEVKIAGRWFTGEEVVKERYQISAQLLFAQMQDLARRSDLVGAMNTFDSLEKSYPGARVFPDAVELAGKILPSLKAASDRIVQSWPQRKKERTDGANLASVPQRSELLAAQQREEKAADASLEAATKAGLKYVPLQNVGDKAAAADSSRAQAELKRLEALPVSKMRASLQQSDAALQQLAKHEDAAAAETFHAATALWAANELAVRHGKELSANAARATPVPVVMATPQPTSTPVPKATPRPVVAVQPSAPEPAEPESKGLSMLWLGIIAVVVLGLVLVATRFLKKKPQDGDESGPVA